MGLELLVVEARRHSQRQANRGHQLVRELVAGVQRHLRYSNIVNGSEATATVRLGSGGRGRTPSADREVGVLNWGHRRRRWR